MANRGSIRRPAAAPTCSLSGASCRPPPLLFGGCGGEEEEEEGGEEREVAAAGAVCSPSSWGDRAAGSAGAGVRSAAGRLREPQLPQPRRKASAGSRQPPPPSSLLRPPDSRSLSPDSICLPRTGKAGRKAKPHRRRHSSTRTVLPQAHFSCLLHPRRDQSTNIAEVLPERPDSAPGMLLTGP